MDVKILKLYLIYQNVVKRLKKHKKALIIKKCI